MSSSWLIRGAVVIDPSQGLEDVRDVWIENGKIAAIDLPGRIPVPQGGDVQTVEAKGFWLVPGLIDLHVHLREPGFEHKETILSGTSAAIAGGVTSVASMANTNPVNDHAAVTQMILAKAREAGQARVFPIGAVTQGLKGEQLAEIGLMAEAGIVALSDDGMPVMNASLMRKAMEYAQAFDLPIISHAEDLTLSQGASMNEGAVSALLGFRGNPAASEEIMVAREIALARLTGARVHIAHLSTEQGLRCVERAKQDGLRVTCEVTPHHLMLTDHALLHAHCCDRTAFKMAPPLRTEKDRLALLDGLKRGVVDMIASDHAPHGCVDKETEFELAANGILGLQTTLPISLGWIREGVLSRRKWVEVMSSRAAQFLNRSDLGHLRPGATADLCLIDPNIQWTLTRDQVVSISKNSPWLERFPGKAFQGKTVGVWVDGKRKL